MTANISIAIFLPIIILPLNKIYMKRIADRFAEIMHISAELCLSGNYYQKNFFTHASRPCYNAFLRGGISKGISLSIFPEFKSKQFSRDLVAEISHLVYQKNNKH
ncbi:hypothetical protein [Bacillus sp. OV322]|uniref:hypothetical protein n=1 Tax=Bacillus sp. OV322 TaxID=1882764 RepID=UPI0015A5D611|nr:hypothetical protein [Bacillus sp. OV322]